MPDTKPVLEIDGARFDSLDGFYDEVSSALIPGASWGRNLNALNDILRGGFGTPENGFVLRWVNSTRSRTTLGYAATCEWLRLMRAGCHPTNQRAVDAKLAAAEASQGPTLFDVLVEIIEHHGPGGDEAEDGVLLVLA